MNHPPAAPGGGGARSPAARPRPGPALPQLREPGAGKGERGTACRRQHLPRTDGSIPTPRPAEASRRRRTEGAGRGHQPSAEPARPLLRARPAASLLPALPHLRVIRLPYFLFFSFFFQFPFILFFSFYFIFFLNRFLFAPRRLGYFRHGRRLPQTRRLGAHPRPRANLKALNSPSVPKPRAGRLLLRLGSPSGESGGPRPVRDTSATAEPAAAPGDARYRAAGAAEPG